MFWRVGRFVVGVVLVPVCVAASQTLMTLVQAIQPESTRLVPPAAWGLVGGFLVWLFLYFTAPRPLRSYVLAHELTHALWGALMGARVSRLNVAREQGSVTLSKTNFLITLAPYFFPLYTVLVVLAYYVAAIFLDVAPYAAWWLGLVGFSWGFHLTFTIQTLMQKQTDIQECGHLFSYATIYLLNVLGICLWVVMVSAVTLEEMVTALAQHTALLLDLCLDGWAAAADRIRAIKG